MKSKEQIERELAAAEFDEFDALLENIPADKKFAGKTPGDFLSSDKKVKSPAVAREIKGVWVSFYTQKGELVLGLGTPYMVVRNGRKLVYKAKDQVTFLPPDWRPGDAMPAKTERPQEIPGPAPTGGMVNVEEDDLLG